MKKLKEVKFEWIDGKLYARETHEDGKEVLVHIKGSPTDYLKKLALEDGITQEDFDRAYVTYKEEERGEEYEIPTTIEGLEELKKKAQGHKKSYEYGIIASDFVIGVCDMKIRKLEREEKQKPVIKLRKVTREDAKSEIMELYKKSPEPLYYSDIIEKLNLDLELVVEIANELEKEGLIEYKWSR